MRKAATKGTRSGHLHKGGSPSKLLLPNTEVFGISLVCFDIPKNLTNSAVISIAAIIQSNLFSDRKILYGL